MLLAPLSRATAATGLSATPLGAQADVTVELGASQIGPPLGIEAETARYAVGGLRASHYGLGGSGVYGSILGGRTLGSSADGDFFTVDVGTTLTDWLTTTVRGGLDVRFLAFGVSAPYPYDAVAVEGGPTLLVDLGLVSWKLAGIAGLGSSSFELRGPLGRTRRFTEELQRIGGTTELAVGRGFARAAVAAGYHDTPVGSFSSVGGGLLFTAAWGALELRGDVWRTPMGTETTGGLAMVIALSGWSLRGFLGRSDPDPLTLARPGGTGGGLLVGRSLYAAGPAPRQGTQPWELVAERAGGATVRIALEAPEGTRKVALLGDFTLWDAVTMEQRNGRWEVEVDVAEGTHHYGFLVDDEWYLPDDTRDVVPDEWGRLSAILVIEGVE